MTHLINTSVVNRLRRPKFSSVMIAAYVITAVHSARALELPDQPVLSEASVEPNIMLMMDNSGSMDWYAMGYYDSSVDYADCPANLALPASQSVSNQEIQAKVDANGMVYFTYSTSSRRGGSVSKNYQWGVARTGNETYDVACFNDGTISGEDILYNLYADTIDDSNLEYTGNALNYYFSNNTQSGPDYWDGTRKVGTDKRIDITKRAGKSLLESLSNKRIGLAAFNQGTRNDGAEILVGIDDIDATVSGKIQRDVVIDQLLMLEPSGGTPIGQSMSDITRYFITGYENNNLTLHPNDKNRKKTAKGSAVFSGTPAYASGVSRPGKGNKAVIEESCQQNFVIALTDGEPQETSRISALLTGLGPKKTSGSSTKGYDNGQANSIDYNFGAFHDVGSLNDVTLAMFDMDLRPDLKADEPVNISTYFVGGFVESLADNEVLISAAKNGVDVTDEGKIYTAFNQTEVEDAFETIFGLMGANAGARNSVAFNSASIEADTLAYQATYENAGYLWEGDLVAFESDTTTTGDVFGTTRAWSANDQLTTRVADVLPGDDRRDIITLSKAQSGARDGIAFTTANIASFSAEMQADLDGDGTDSTMQAKVVNYLRGAEFEGEFRDRTPDGSDFGILGDIVHSTPVEVGAPELDYPDYEAGSLSFGSAAKPYYKFEKSNQNRDSVVYVGANDGMLHAFSGGANGGKELFAYVPSLLADGNSEIDGLFYLTDNTYQHKFYVDGSIGVSDVFIDPNGANSKSWRTALFGTLGLGGKGIYALDITDPKTFSEAKAKDIVLWEFDGGNNSSTGDPDMGHIFGEPKISMMNDGSFAVVVGNGANSTNGKAVLFILFIEEGADGSWDVGDWIELDTGVGGDNGLMTPTLIDMDNDRVVDRIYAGDLNGNMWSFDVRSDTPAEWEIAHGSSGSPDPLFTAKDATGNAQPITSAPLVVINQETPSTDNNAPNVLVLFGTGQLIEKSDINDTNKQSFYAVWDNGDGALLRSDLLERKIIDKTTTGREFESASPYSDPVNWFGSGSDKEYGWFMDLPEKGERITVQPTLLSGTLMFLSSIPQSTPCSGSGFGYLNILTTEGTATKTPIFDFNGDGKIDGDDQDYVSLVTEGKKGLPAGSEFIGAGEAEASPCTNGNGFYQAYSTVEGAIQYRWVCPEFTGGLGRMAWQELFGQ